MSAVIQECLSCAARLFPNRLFCPECGGDSFSDVAVAKATVETTTTLSNGVVIATVSPDGGPRLIARLTGSGASPGQTVPLTNSSDATPGVHAYIPPTIDANEEHR
ncbi:Zn-ribbon domain-containing OB-fold protein [Paenarthrobacter sp. NyZ202]|uniref:Zn-ribbon domain-containing OB-fold protein n=1 Tax=Paenarthrobacter sp. NyZ202 TaxID=3402689 RepID=UPI003CED7C5A